MVFFPGSVPVYVTINGVAVLAGGLGVSGDGVTEDDVITNAASIGYAAPASLRADSIYFQGVRLPYLKFDRNPEGA